VNEAAQIKKMRRAERPLPLENALGKTATLLAPLVSAVLLVAAFPNVDRPACVWVGLAPLLAVLASRRPAQGFILAYVCGIVFFAGVFSWSFEIPGYRLYHQVVLALVISLYFGIFGLLFSYLSGRLGIVAASLGAPFIWVGLAYARANLPILALPWPQLAHAEYQQLLVIQIAALAGAYGVSFVIVLVNATLAALVHAALHRNGIGASTDRTIARGGLILLTTAALAAVAFTLIYGFRVLSRPLPEKTVRLSILQGNIDQEKKGNPRKHAPFIMQRYTELTRLARRDDPDMIVWPEAATPGLVLKHVGLFGQLRALVREEGTYFLIGSSEFPKFDKALLKQRRPANTALFISPEGKVLGQYLKIRLLPFGEYLPYADHIPWPDFIMPDASKDWEIPGGKTTLFELDGIKFGVIICWENAFPSLFRRFVKKGANFMLNITNEGWFGESAAPYQFLAMSVLRAVENRVSLARAANTGVSCFIDPHGRITGRVRKGGKDIYVAGYLTQPVHVTEEKTVYTRYGDIFVLINMLVAFGLILLAYRKGRAR